MPQTHSRKQWRLMMAIIHGEHGKTARGDHGPPASIASKYTAPDKDAPESKGKEHHGGRWDKKKKDKKHLKKCFVGYYKGRGAGCIVINNKNEILIGVDSKSGLYTFPGGHVKDGESFEEGAHRELREEAGIVSQDIRDIGNFHTDTHDNKVFLVTKYSGKVKSSDEVKDWKFMDIACVAGLDMRQHCKLAMELLINSNALDLKNTNLSYMTAKEELAKNILRGPNGRDATFDVSHGDALKLVGSGLFRRIKQEVEGMVDEDFKDFHIDTYTVNIRKHMNDVYSGRVYDGHKLVHQFTNKSLPQLTADLMSVFEWYLPGDDDSLNSIMDENMPDDAIHGGLHALSENYTKHNLANIYKEMEHLRQEIRNDVSVDIQQVESRIMKLFDKLEGLHRDMSDKHNKLCNDAGVEIETVEAKLRELQNKIDSIGSRPSTVEAFSARPTNPSHVYSEGYMYLSKPSVVIEPNGRIHITFGGDWNQYDKGNFLNDMKAKAIKKSR